MYNLDRMLDALEAVMYTAMIAFGTVGALYCLTR